MAGRRCLPAAVQAVAVVCLAVMTSGCLSVPVLTPAEVETVTLRPSPWWIDFDRVAVIDITGIMTSSSGSSILWSRTGIADVKARLDRAAADWRVKAVVLRIDTPGGEVTAADALHRQVSKFREETGIPVVACLMKQATSGGYYVACACDRIVAFPTNITGSVGVIMQFFNVEGLLGKVGLRRIAIKSGDKKDIASGARPMTPEEREILNRINRELFERFVNVVRTGRPQMSKKDLELIKDGRVLTAPTALRLGMVDKLGFLEDAVQEAMTLAGIETADVIGYRVGHDPNEGLYAGTQAEPPSPEAWSALREALQGILPPCEPGFLYLWAPAQ